MKERIYIFSGLGADERVFKNITFGNHEIIHVKWIKPEENESLSHYAKRVSSQITEPDPILIGVSFGGIVALELSDCVKPKKIILISSAKTQSEIPTLYRLAGKLRLHKLIPPVILKHSSFISNRLFGTRSESDKRLLKQILADTDTHFLKWAINAVITRNTRTNPANIIHIHGTRDRILPIRNISCDITIKGGGHLMVLNESDELNEILERVINKG